MPGDLPNPAPDDGRALSGSTAEEARDYLMAELHAARSAAVRAGADPDAVTAELAERVRLARDLLTARQQENRPVSD